MSAQDLLHADDVMRADLDRMAALRFLFVDHSLASGLSADTHGIRELAERSKNDTAIVPAERGTIAIAAPSLLLYGMTRMWMFLSDTPFACNVFRERNETTRWLREQVLARTGRDVDLGDPAFAPPR